MSLIGLRNVSHTCSGVYFRFFNVIPIFFCIFEQDDPFKGKDPFGGMNETDAVDPFQSSDPFKAGKGWRCVGGVREEEGGKCEGG